MDAGGRSLYDMTADLELQVDDHLSDSLKRTKVMAGPTHDPLDTI